MAQPWEVLNKPSFESLVYLAFYSPKEKQSEGVEIIYGKEAKYVNLKPVIRCRRWLSDKGYLKVSTSYEDLRRKVMASQPEPFIQYAKRALVWRNRIRVLNEDETQILRMILDSSWFREAFFSNSNLSMKIGRREDGRLVLADAMFYIADKIESTSAITIGSALLLSEYLPSTTDILEESSFDQFMIEWRSRFDDKYLGRVTGDLLRFAEKRLGEASRTFLEKTLLGRRAALCIPIELAEKTCRLGRIPLTVLLAFIQASEELRTSRSKGY